MSVVTPVSQKKYCLFLIYSQNVMTSQEKIVDRMCMNAGKTEEYG